MELRPLAEADLPALEAWLPQAAREAGCERWSMHEALRSAIGNASGLVGNEKGAQSFLEYATGEPKRAAARVRFLAVSPERRRHGAGHRSAIALEALLPASIKRLYVSIPARLGLSLYFWLRLGYRPLTQREWPAPPEDPPSVWMVREVG
jgi:hypothetical protein